MEIPYESLDTPWVAQEIVWRYPSRTKRHEALRRQVDSGNTHIVREVRVDKAYGGPESIAHASSVVARTEEEFSLMRSIGIQIAPTEWYIFSDDEQRVRTLARVAVIEGMELEPIHQPHLATREQRLLLADAMIKIDSYNNLTNGKRRLNDVYLIDQYLYGSPRALEGNTNPELYLIDIEPIFTVKY